MPNRVDVICGHIEIAVVVLQVQIIALDATHLLFGHAEVFADAVNLMHDKIARFQIFKDARRTSLRRFDDSVSATTTRQVAFGDNRQLVIIENAADM